MSELRQLQQWLSDGRITRREFLARSSALGLTAGLSTTLLSDRAFAGTPKKGGRLRLGITDSDPRISTGRGVYIDNVFDPSPAAAAGVQVGDCLLAIDDGQILAVSDFQRAMYVSGAGKKIMLTLYRQGEILKREVTMVMRPDSVRIR